MSDINLTIKSISEKAVSDARLVLEASIKDESTVCKKQIINFLVSNLEGHGIEGFAITEKFLKDFCEGNPVDFTGLDLISASDILVEIQKAEEHQKKLILAYATEIGKILGAVLSAIIKSSIF